ALDTAMTPFRLGKVDGLNVEADIRSAAKGGSPVTAKDAELIAVRSAAIASYAIHYPNEKANNPATKAKWEKLSKEMMSISKEIAEEAGKGGDQKKLTGLFKKL